jgi:hypothetical protein
MTTTSILLRLRSANPVPRPENVSDADLFARITALPLDRRLRRRAPGYRRPVLAFAVVVAATALLASAAFAVSQWIFPSVVGPTVTKSEYRRAQHQLTLPPGYSWPGLHIPANTVTSPGAGGGHAVLAAQNAWECYWVKAIRNRDAAGEWRAHRELGALLDNNVIVAPPKASENGTPPDPPKAPYAVFAADGGLQWVRETYRLAAAGHPQRLIDSCRANAAG